MSAGPAVPMPGIAMWPPMDSGRLPAARALVDWATDVSSPRLCLIRGARQAGKSHLLAWFLAGSAAHPRTTAHGAVPSRGLTAETFAWELGRQLQYGPLPPPLLLDRVAFDQRPLLLLVPDLHLAGRGPADLPQATPQPLVDEVIAPLLALPHVRAVVEVGQLPLLADFPDLAVISLGEKPYAPIAEPAPRPTDLTAVLATVPRSPDGRPEWRGAPAPAREHALDLALPVGHRAVQALLTDPGFLVHGSATAITATLADQRITLPSGLRPAWRRAAPLLTSVEPDDLERAAILHAAALDTAPQLAEFLRPLAAQHHWTALWAQPDAHVTALAHTPGDEPELLAADPLGQLRTYDPATGTAKRHLPSPTTVRPIGIATPDSHTPLLLDERGTLHRAAAPEEDDDAEAGDGATARLIAEHHSRAALAAEGSRPTAVDAAPGRIAVGDARGTVHLWSSHEPAHGPRSQHLHPAPVLAVTCLHLPADELTLVISAALDGTVRLWEVSTGPMRAPVEQRNALVTALASAATPAGPLLVVAWSDGRLHLWNLFTAKMRPVPLLHRADALTLTPAGLLTTAGPDGMYATQLTLGHLWQ